VSLPRAEDRAEIEPDPRFTLANERTYLAWIRTALALIAAGVALQALAAEVPRTGRSLVAAALLALGIGSALTGHARWLRVQRALRQQLPLPGLGASAVLGYAVAAIGVLLVVLA